MISVSYVNVPLVLSSVATDRIDTLRDELDELCPLLLCFTLLRAVAAPLSMALRRFSALPAISWNHDMVGGCDEINQQSAQHTKQLEIDNSLPPRACKQT